MENKDVSFFKMVFNEKKIEEKTKREEENRERFLKICELEWLMDELRRLEGLLAEAGSRYKAQQKWLASHKTDPRYEKLASASKELLHFGKYLNAKRRHQLNMCIDQANLLGSKLEKVQLKSSEIKLIDGEYNWELDYEGQLDTLKNIFLKK